MPSNILTIHHFQSHFINFHWITSFLIGSLWIWSHHLPHIFLPHYTSFRQPAQCHKTPQTSHMHQSLTCLGIVFAHQPTAWFLLCFFSAQHTWQVTDRVSPVHSYPPSSHVSCPSPLRTWPLDWQQQQQPSLPLLLSLPHQLSSSQPSSMPSPISILPLPIFPLLT